MSLRDSSSHCVQQLIHKLSEGEEEDSHKSNMFTVLIKENLLPQIRDKIKIKMEVKEGVTVEIKSYRVYLAGDFRVFFQWNNGSGYL